MMLVRCRLAAIAGGLGLSPWLAGCTTAMNLFDQDFLAALGAGARVASVPGDAPALLVAVENHTDRLIRAMVSYRTEETGVETVTYPGDPTSDDPERCGFAGTSAAAPHVAGAAVLVKQAYPNYTPDQLQQFLEDNADDLGTVGKDNVYGAGLVHLPAPP